MRAMVYPGEGRPLALEERPVPAPGAGEVLVRVAALGAGVERFRDGERLRDGERVGVPWPGWTCGACRYCRSGRENLCADARFTGYTLDGGE